MGMKVLWFSTVPVPAICRRLNLTPSYGGWWIWSLLRELTASGNIEVAAAWAHRGCNAAQRFKEDGATYYIFAERGRFIRGGGVRRRFDDEFGYIIRFGRDRRALADAVRVVEDYQPDLVHVFGSESRYGLLASLIGPPVVIWIQGLLDVYRHHFFGSMRPREWLKQPRLLCTYYRMAVNAAREREIFRRCRYFIGRTRWDAAHQARLQPEGRYYAVQDCLRPDFYNAEAWRLEGTTAQTVYTTTSASLFKGTDVLVRAIALLERRLPGIRLRVAGALASGDPVVRRLNKLVENLGLTDRVRYLGQLDGAQIVQELRQARVFVLPSFIENNPNSLAEAQLVGLPVVAAAAGGVLDMVTDGETGLLFQAGDSTTLAWQIARLLTDDDLAARIASQARRVAQDRHSPARIVDSVLKAYDDIIMSNCLPRS